MIIELVLLHMQRFPEVPKEITFINALFSIFGLRVMRNNVRGNGKH